MLCVQKPHWFTSLQDTVDTVSAVVNIFIISENHHNYLRISTMYGEWKSDVVMPKSSWLCYQNRAMVNAYRRGKDETVRNQQRVIQFAVPILYHLYYN